MTQQVKRTQGIEDRKQKTTMASAKKPAFKGLITIILVYAVACFIIYSGSMPVTYPLKVNDVSSYDINAPRTIINKQETEQLAEEAMASVKGKMVKNEEKTAVSLANIESFLDLVSTRRNRLYSSGSPSPTIQSLDTINEHQESKPTTSSNQVLSRTPSQDEIQTASTSMVSQINQTYNIDFDIAYATSLLSMEPSRYEYFAESLKRYADSIMQKALDTEQLQKEIDNFMRSATEDQMFFTADIEISRFLLGHLLSPNVEYDAQATQKAREEAANQIRNNPIFINQGTRIVSQGDVITEDLFQILEELNLTDQNQFDWKKMAGIALENLVLMVVVVAYFHFFHNHTGMGQQSVWALIFSLLIPLAVSFYSANPFPLSPPIYFSTIIICAYFDFKTAIVLSTVLAIAIHPMTAFNTYFIPVSIVGCLVAGLFSRKIYREDNYVKLILATTISTVSMTLALSVIREVTLSNLLVNVISVSISSMISVIAAIGVMPVFELIFNTVSPMKIIELSQPGQPLMKRLFSEAPGTSQHSMMVANLADAGCEAIGADTNLVRVGAYYHDIGKLENPIMFTENQSDVNPHDQLSPEESCQILTAHTEDGVKLGRKYHLPEPVLKMIHEHHGTTILQYFYHKACKLAEQEGKEQPDPDLYRYHNPLPSFRESAVLMLADSVEAAMKSAAISDVDEAEKFMRSIFKIKIDQNQLVESGLSFHDVEMILKAFLQVYAGQFHKRVKYPEPVKLLDSKK